MRGLKNRGIRLCAKVVPGSFRMILLSTFPEEPLTGKLGHESLQLVLTTWWPRAASLTQEFSLSHCSKN